MKIRETIQSNEFTRERRSCGISRCCRVSQIVFPKTIPAAKSALPRAITSAGSGGTSARRGSAPSDQATIAKGTGLFGLKRRARRPPSRPPIAPPVRTIPHAVAPPSSSAAISGPSTNMIPMPTFATAAARNPTLSQMCDQASRAPSNRSARKCWRGEGSRGLSRRRARKTALIAKLNESMA